MHIAWSRGFSLIFQTCINCTLIRFGQSICNLSLSLSVSPCSFSMHFVMLSSYTEEVHIVVIKFLFCDFLLSTPCTPLRQTDPILQSYSFHVCIYVCINLCVYYMIIHIYMYYIHIHLLCLWKTCKLFPSVNVMTYSSIHFSTNNIVSFFFMTELYSIVYIFHIFLIYT
jgi:hypothetical protein